MKKMSVLLVLVVLLLAVAPVANAIAFPRTRTITITEETCFTDAENVTHYAFVNMNALEITDPALNDGTLFLTEMGGGVVEYGYYTAAHGYQVLGWRWIVDDVPQYSALEGGQLTLAQLEGAVAAFSGSLRENCHITEIEVEVEVRPI
ncbi:MAG: hypothetical protein JXN59_17265 [Anaerolineae bacterium]|nr:hypothetical protein [Anaerolineae bacterium]